RALPAGPRLPPVRGRNLCNGLGRKLSNSLGRKLYNSLPLGGGWPRTLACRAGSAFPRRRGTARRVAGHGAMRRREAANKSLQPRGAALTMGLFVLAAIPVAVVGSLIGLAVSVRMAKRQTSHGGD